MHILEIPEINRLSIPEKILLVEELWDSIAAEATAAPVPKSQLAGIGTRLKRHAAPPGELLSLDELQSRIESRQ